MYNGIGLTTPRGSGTNGYVQKNIAFINESKQKSFYKTEKEIEKVKTKVIRKPNKDILDHERKRKIELKCAEFECKLESIGIPQEEITERVSALREELRSKELKEEENKKSWKTSCQGTHEIAEAQEIKNASLRQAFKISEYFVEGTSLDPTRRAKEAGERAKKEPEKRYELLKSPTTSPSMSPTVLQTDTNLPKAIRLNNKERSESVDPENSKKKRARSSSAEEKKHKKLKKRDRHHHKHNKNKKKKKHSREQSPKVEKKQKDPIHRKSEVDMPRSSRRRSRDVSRERDRRRYSSDDYYAEDRRRVERRKSNKEYDDRTSDDDRSRFDEGKKHVSSKKSQKSKKRKRNRSSSSSAESESDRKHKKSVKSKRKKKLKAKKYKRSSSSSELSSPSYSSSDVEHYGRLKKSLLSKLNQLKDEEVRKLGKIPSRFRKSKKKLSERGSSSRSRSNSKSNKRLVRKRKSSSSSIASDVNSKNAKHSKLNDTTNELSRIKMSASNNSKTPSGDIASSKTAIPNGDSNVTHPTSKSPNHSVNSESISPKKLAEGSLSQQDVDVFNLTKNARETQAAILHSPSVPPSQQSSKRRKSSSSGSRSMSRSPSPRKSYSREKSKDRKSRNSGEINAIKEGRCSPSPPARRTRSASDMSIGRSRSPDRDGTRLRVKRMIMSSNSEDRSRSSTPASRDLYYPTKSSSSRRSSFSSSSDRSSSESDSSSSSSDRSRRRRRPSDSSEHTSRSSSRSVSIPRRNGSPSFLDRRRITSERKKKSDSTSGSSSSSSSS